MTIVRPDGVVPEEVAKARNELRVVSESQGEQAVLRLIADKLSLMLCTEFPDLQMTSGDGQRVRFHEFQGEPIYVVYAGTWCPHGRAKIQDLLAHDWRHPSGRIVLLFNDEFYTQARVVRRLLKDVPEYFYLDGPPAASHLEYVRAFPTIFILDSEGIIQEIEVAGAGHRSCDEEGIRR